MGTFLEKCSRSLYFDKKHYDCEFFIGKNKKAFRAHKLILSLASKEFEEQVYSSNSSEFIVPDVEPVIFEALLRYIYLNELPFTQLHRKCENDSEIMVDLWYATIKYGLNDLINTLNMKLKIKDTNVFQVYIKSHMLLKDAQPSCYVGYLNHRHNAVNTFVSKCLKVFSVKTAELLCSDGFMTVSPSSLKDLFAVQHMNLDSELDLFKALVKFANENGWTPNCQYLEQNEIGSPKGLTPLQSDIRDALMQIRFLNMTIMEFDDLPSRSGYFTETEVEMIRKGIAEGKHFIDWFFKSGFSSNTAKRYEIIQLFDKNIQKLDDQTIDKLTFRVEFSKYIFEESNLSITEPIVFGDLPWRIIIFRRRRYEYTFYLKCCGKNTKDWKYYAQLDLDIEFGHLFGPTEHKFENIPWYCFKRDANYSQLKAFQLRDSINNLHGVLSISPLRVSVKNENSNVRMTYGKESYNYE